VAILEIKEPHMTRMKIALAAALLMSTATAALADNGHMNRTKRHTAHAGATQATPVRLNQAGNMSAPNTNNLMMNVMDRASSPFACGG
jgi:hypothetical protein